MTRRDLLLALTSASLLTQKPTYQLAPFSAEVTIPPGHPLMGGGVAPAKSVADPLWAHGFVLLGAGDPIVLVSIDWCEIRNDAYTRWREVLAKAAKTSPMRVLVSCIHQHDAPIADLTAEKLLRDAKARGSICDPSFHERAVQRVARALAKSLASPRRITHLGTGQAKVEKIGSNRRFLLADGKVSYSRTSATKEVQAHRAPEGTIDPWLKTLSFWDGEKALAALSVYATHPMSYYGTGAVSADFPGLARKRRQADLPQVLQIYASGASGNITAGKYNDGNPENRVVLADRLYQAMERAWKDTQKIPLDQISFHSVAYQLPVRESPGFTLEDLSKRLKEDPRPFGQCLAALGLSWRQRCDSGHKLDLPVIDLGTAQILLLPGEVYVEYQLLAQKLRPDSFVLTLGYGECAPGYVPTAKALAEKDSNLRDWCWVGENAEKALTEALQAALKKR